MRVLVIVASVLFVISTLVAQTSAEPTRQLLVDNFIVDKQAGLKRIVQQPQRVSQRPIVKADRPWEGQVLEMPCVLWDPAIQSFRMYYWAVNGDNIYTCYAVSKDGILWHKPILNLHADTTGSKRNNIVLRGTGKVARTRYVFFNPDKKDRKRRFLSIYIDNVPGLTEFFASSPDGLHWTTEKKIGDLRNVRGGKVTSNPHYFLVEQQWGKDANDGHRYRAIWRTESQDAKSWTGGRLVIERLPDDNADLEFYHATAHPLSSNSYHGIHFGYLFLYHTDSVKGVRPDGVRLEGTIDTSLMISRDTIHWRRLDRKRRFLPLGPKGSWEASMNFTMPEVVVGDRMLFYYCAFRKSHGAKDNEAGIGLGILPLDRFVSFEPTKNEGSFTTKPLVVAGQKLTVNTDARKGSVSVEVLQPDGTAIRGFSASECVPIRGNHLRAKVRWSDASLQSLKGKRVRLRFKLKRAKVFAFEL